ncbi:nucleolar protein 58 [Danaus plexippus]|uniref:Nucleolar protein 58 n=1 Tax=Danaus plexippus plexippus TaxID=278856 RepID=A0A212FGN2_DANPL|nr:nucleolar protein 58 [Danaus plexippus]OWR52895.1 Nucleolar protein 5 [Danaus plexippus plexippus]
MLVLFETPAGYAIFKLLDESKLSQIDDLYQEFNTPEGASSVVKLKNFIKFEDTTEALAATTAAIEGKLSKTLKKGLKKHLLKDVQDQLLVGDAKLGSAIKEKFDLQCVSNSNVQELLRCIRSQMDSLLTGLPKKEMTAMALGLAHSLSRYKLKFSPDKIDTMIVQAQCLLDDLDKELNNYVMRCREWYGWHFPELGKIITDNTSFVKIVKLMGTRDHAATTDMSDILPEDLEEKVKEAAEISMGTEISDDDIINIQNLCDEIVSITDYRAHLTDYLKARMMAMAPNLTVLIGEHIGARLIAHAGSLMNLAKHPASTLQIFGAEKALFRALKTKKDTPKYGLIYHAQLIGQCSTKNKGKMSRMLAAKAALATRVDAFGDDVTFELGAKHKVNLENKLRLLEEGNLRRISGTGKAKAKFEKYHSKSEVFSYPTAADSTLKAVKREHEPEEEAAPAKKMKLENDVKVKKVKSEPSDEVDGQENGDSELTEKKKKKKKKSMEPELAQAGEQSPVSEKKKKKSMEPELAQSEEAPASEKKKKKKRQSQPQEE